MDGLSSGSASVASAGAEPGDVFASGALGSASPERSMTGASVVSLPPGEELTLESLPSFSRNLLRIKVPVMVTLAAKKQPVAKIVELLPGSIIQFSKSCEEMLEMEVGGYPIALGECVKVGDKFGLRITSIQLPGERFVAVGRP